MPLPAKCFRCDLPPIALCQICENPMCKAHQSVDDPDFCEECVSPINTQIKSEPLIDTEGVAHEGRHMELEGDGWLSSIGVIAKLSDEELPRWVEKHMRLLREAEQRRDYHKIMLGAIQMESEDRRMAGVKLARRLGSEMPPSIRIAASEARQKKPAKQGLDGLIDKLKAAGVTKEMLVAMLAQAQAGAKK